MGITDGSQHTTSFSFNQAGYISAITDPGRQTIQFPQYDLAGRPKQRIDARNQTTSYGYGDLDRMLTTITYPEQTVTLGWDNYDRLMSRSDGAGSETYGYDDNDDPTSDQTKYNSTDPNGLTISYGYWPNGSRHTMTLPTGSFTSEYDGAGRPYKLTNPLAEVSQWTYWDNGWLQTQTLQNGVTTTYTPNPLGLLQELATKTSGGTILTDFLGTRTGGPMRYDGAGNRTSMYASIPAASAFTGSASYAYDFRNELVQEQTQRSENSNQYFGFDLTGNPTAVRQSVFGFDLNNQNLADVSDNSGNPTTYQGVAGYLFDSENRMTQAGSALAVGYRGDGLRAWKQPAGGARTWFLYDGSMPVLEFTSANNVNTITATNTFGANGLLSRNSGGASTFYDFDPQGNVAQRLDSNANVLSSHYFDAFGAEHDQPSGTPTTAFGYGAQSGYYTDSETSLVLLTNRYYDPARARFVTRDPIGLAGGTNQYGFVGNNPLSGIDPLGLCGNDAPDADTEAYIGRVQAGHRQAWGGVRAVGCGRHAGA